MATPSFGFTVPADDRSVYYLSQIFGRVGDVLGGSPTLIGTLFLTINTIALTVGAVIVVYTTVVGMMKTAHEGEFLGKQWNSPWLPIRMVIGVAALFPAKSGYSMIQVIIMWIIVQGIGAADTLWTTALNFPAIQGAVNSASNATSSAMIGMSNTMKNIFNGMVCEETSQMTVPFVPASEINFGGQGGGSPPSDITGSRFMFGSNGACGILQKCDSTNCAAGGTTDSVYCALCRAQTAALRDNILPAMRQIAQSFVRADSEYITFYYTANKGTALEPDAPGQRAKGWIVQYCEKSNPPLSVKDVGATCCNPPIKQQPEPQSCLMTPERVFPQPFTTNPKTNNMSTGPNSELDWIQRWVLFPEVTGNAAPVETITDFKKADFIKILTDYYTNSLIAGANSVDPSKLTPPAQEEGSDFNPDTAKKYGWVTAGAYFYQIVMVSRKSLTSTTLPFNMTNVDKAIGERNYRTNFQAAGEFLDKIITPPGTKGGPGPRGGGGSGSVSLPGEGGSAYGAAITETSGSLSSSWMNMLRYSSRANQSSLLSIATFGQNLLIIAQVFYVVLIGLAAIFAGLAAIPTFVAAGFGNITVATEIFKAIASYLLPAVFILLGALMTMGALLGMYVPMIPFIVFTASVVGWFIAVVEAMVAAPIIALGLLSPGGQSEVFGRAEPSLMIIFNLFLRPTLMVFGLLVAAFVAEQVISFICLGFRFAMWDVMNLEASGLVEEVIFIAIFTSIVITSLNQVFTLIHHIPERILTYIGGQAYQYGEAQAAQAVKGAVEGAAGGLAGAGKGTVEGARDTAVSVGKHMGDEKKKKGPGVKLQQP